ncbi:MAG: alpha/beta hydrolase, partial [Hyphomicrobiales bacterium]|nr:alpha/beta hydrolase [Hyphomicrobiales bacterium]
MSNWANTILESPTGASLQLYSALSGTRPRAIVQINHGLGEHGARYQRFAEFLNASGYDAYVHDHRGHGAT